MQRAPVTVPNSIANGAVGTNFVRTTRAEAGSIEDVDGEDPILMLHGFDSSLLEFRRLMPKLGELGAEAYAVDVLGWGFTQLSGVSSFGAGACVLFRSLLPSRFLYTMAHTLPVPTPQTNTVVESVSSVCPSCTPRSASLLLRKGFSGATKIYSVCHRDTRYLHLL